MINIKQKVCKFEINDLLPIGFVLIVAGVGIAYGVNVLGDIKEDFGVESCGDRTDGFTSYNATSGLCYNSTLNTQSPTDAYFNASTDSILGVAKLPEKMPLIATVIVAAVIIGILVRYLMVRYS